MDNRELLRTLSGCTFYQRYLESQHPIEPVRVKPQSQPPPPPRTQRRRKHQLYRRYCFALGVLLLGAMLLIVAPLWTVHPQYGKAVFLSLPPMLLCALSWMSGVWWAWDKDRSVLFAVTLGASPVRLVRGLGWAWLVLSIVEIPFFAFALGLMWHWMLFTVPELAMMYELSQNPRTVSHGRLAASGKPSRLAGYHRGLGALRLSTNAAMNVPAAKGSR